MLLYIVRHAFAGEPGDERYSHDSLRPVTKKGRKQFDQLVKSLRKCEVAPKVIGTSPYLRCVQTADVLVERLENCSDRQLVETFAPGCQLSDVLAWARQFAAQDLAFVGHAPDVNSIAAALLGAADESLHFAKGAIAAVEFGAEFAPGKGTLLWFVTPKLIT